MPALSSMQRNLTYKRPLAPLLYFALFVVYSSLSSIYLTLPPLLAVLFVLYSNAIKNKNFLYIMLISFCLVLFEANYGYLLFSTIIYFTLVYKFIIPKIIQNFSCNSCVKISYVLVAYLGYYLFLIILSKIFLLPPPSINYYIVYYIIIEFFFVSLL
jgi:hypothetical protein